jgi:hypothetical protein
MILFLSCTNKSSKMTHNFYKFGESRLRAQGVTSGVVFRDCMYACVDAMECGDLDVNVCSPDDTYIWDYLCICFDLRTLRKMCAETESEAILEDNFLGSQDDQLPRELAASGVPVARLGRGTGVRAALGSTCDRGRDKQTARVERQHSTRVAACNSQLRKMIQVWYCFFLAQTNQAK